MTKSLKIDLLVVLLLIFLSVFLVLFFKVKFLTSTFLYFVLPSLYLLARWPPRNFKRIIVGSTLIGLLLGFSLDFLAEFNNAWAWADGDKLFFPHKIFGVVAPDVLIWFFFWAFSIIVFYEHFLEHDRSRRISSNIWYALIPGCIWFCGIVILFFVYPDWLRFSYAYLVLSLCALIPFFYLSFKKPVLFVKFLKVLPFFTLLYLVFELTALHLGQWSFSGQYIGRVEVVGGLWFPLEEFIFWILGSSSVVLSYYELYVDDER